MGDGLTSCLIVNYILTILRYLFRANIVGSQPMGDEMTRQIFPIGIQKVDERGQNVLQKLR